MSKVWKPSKSQCATILQAAALIVGKGVGSIFVDAGLRFDDEKESLNWLLLGEETDVVDFVSWSEFKKGVQLTDDGRAEVDFYIRPKNVRDTNLLSNLYVQVLDGEIVYLTEHGPEGYCYLFDAERAIQARPKKSPASA